MESKKLNFEISYILDLLCFIDVLLEITPNLEKDVIKEFEDSLGTESKKYLKKIKKILPKRESIESLIAPLVVADPDFSSLKVVKTTEILGHPKYLIKQFKLSPQYQQVSKTFKKFLKKDATKVLIFLEVIVSDLELAKFKSYWLSRRLPIIKNKVREYERQISLCSLMNQLNHWCELPARLDKQKIYLLTYTNAPFIDLLNGDIAVSGINHTNQLTRSLIEEVFTGESIELELKSLKKKLKKNKELMGAFKDAKKEHKTIMGYIDRNLYLALTTYLKEQFGALTQPHDYLKSHHFGTYKISILFYEYIKLFPKKETQPITEYFSELLECVDIDGFEETIERLSSLRK